MGGNTKDGKVLVIAIYSHPEYYPPTLSALEYLSEIYDRIYIVHRNITAFTWDYPSNIQLLSAAEPLHVRDAEKASFKKKLQWFLQFSRLVRDTIRKYNAHTVLIYDFMPLLTYRLFLRSGRQPAILWYHNHDVAEEVYLRKYSISWWAWKSERWIFPRLDIFSLPSVERKEYFPMEKLKGQFYFLPNFPSLKVYERVPGSHTIDGPVVKLLYQGSIGALHGLEEIIGILSNKVHGKTLHLVLKGFISQEYLQSLYKLADDNGVRDQVSYIPPTSYTEVIANAKTCHIGIGIHKKTDIMNKTLGTASNKIYEYAAAGMPALIYDNPHFRASLQNREWVFFTDTSASSLIQCIGDVLAGYDRYSAKARADFKDGLCFEHYFEPVAAHLRAKTG